MHVRVAAFFFSALLVSFWVCACAPAVQTPQSPTAVEPSLPPATQTPESASAPAPVAMPLPSAAPSATPAGCREAHGRIERQEARRADFPIALRVRIYLPPCYGEEAGRRYPLLILLHGQSQDETLWERLGLVEETERLIAAGEIEPFIVVMPREEYYLQEPSESLFGRALTELLLPWVERTYSVSPQRERRAIGGISRGAFWATRVGWENWQMFASIGAHSLPAVPFYEVAFRDLYKTIPENQRPRYYMDHGVLDGYLRDANEWHNLLVKYMAAHTWVSSPGGHTEAYWGGQMETYLRWYAAPWKEQP